MSLLYEKLKNPKQKLFIISSAAGNSILKACEMADITRTTYYEWVKSCKDFVAACKEIEELKTTQMQNTLALGAELAIKDFHYFPYLKYWLERHAPVQTSQEDPEDDLKDIKDSIPHV